MSRCKFCGAQIDWIWSQERGFIQCGEPYSHEYDPETGHWKATFATFQKQGDTWHYCGNCFAGKSTEPKKAQIRGVL